MRIQVQNGVPATPRASLADLGVPDEGGSKWGSSKVKALLTCPREYALGQNHPNPFNPNTHIAYQLPEAGEVSMMVYNLLGQQVRVLVRGRQEAGVYRVTWDGKDTYGQPASSGIYLYRLASGGFVQTRRMLLLK